MGLRDRSNSERTRVKSVFRRRRNSQDHPAPVGILGDASEKASPSTQQQQQSTLEAGQLPQHETTRVGRNGSVYNHNGHRVTRGIQPEGESGRKGVSPLMFVSICFKSSCTASMFTNLLWPFTIAALILHWGFPDQNLWIFITAYIGMVPSANLIGFAGQELARKIPTVWGVLLETTLGSVVELILFVTLIRTPSESNVHVIQAAILGSILANLLLCLGLCFFVGGIFHEEQTFHEAISEVGGNLMFVASLGLVVPTIFYNSLSGSVAAEELKSQTLSISHATAIVLLVSFLVYLFFQLRSHHGLYEDILKEDERADHDRWGDLSLWMPGHDETIADGLQEKEKLTFTEAVIAVALGIAFVSLMAIFLVQQIDYIRDVHGIRDSFLGLILIPVVEKAAEHLTALDESYDNQMNFALSHVLGSSIQTSLFTAPLAVLIAWGLNVQLSLNFELFDAVLLVLAVLAIGNFLRDEKSDYLEGSLSVLVYILIAICAFYYPDPHVAGEPTSSATENVARRAVGQIADRMMHRAD